MSLKINFKNTQLCRQIADNKVVMKNSLKILTFTIFLLISLQTQAQVGFFFNPYMYGAGFGISFSSSRNQGVLLTPNYLGLGYRTYPTFRYPSRSIYNGVATRDTLTNQMMAKYLAYMNNTPAPSSLSASSVDIMNAPKLQNSITTLKR